MRYNQNGHSERRRAFFSGVMAGFAAPVLLISGGLDVSVSRRSSSIGNAWHNVGQFIRSGAEQYQRKGNISDDTGRQA